MKGSRRARLAGRRVSRTKPVGTLSQAWSLAWGLQNCVGMTGRAHTRRNTHRDTVSRSEKLKNKHLCTRHTYNNALYCRHTLKSPPHKVPPNTATSHIFHVLVYLAQWNLSRCLFFSFIACCSASSDCGHQLKVGLTQCCEPLCSRSSEG